MKLTDLNPISDAISGGIKGLSDSIGDIVDRFKLTPDEKVKAKTEWQQLLYAHEAEVAEQLAKLETLAQADRESARTMQVAALQQQAWLPKNFIYLLAIVIITGAFAFLISLFWVKIPEANKRMVEMFADMFLFSGAAMVLNFFFGSSAGSKQKTEIMAAQSVITEVKPEEAKPSDIDEVMLTKRQRRKLSE